MTTIQLLFVLVLLKFSAVVGAMVHNYSFTLTAWYSNDLPDQLVNKVVSSLEDLIAPPIQNTELRVAQYAPRYRLAFSLLNEDASHGGAIVEWSIERAIGGQ